MTVLERKIVAVAVLLTLLWVGVLFAVYMLGDSTASSHTTLDVPEIARFDEPITPALSAVSGSLVFPPAAAVPPTMETPAEVAARRKTLLAIRSQANEDGPMYGWDSRFTDGKGTVLELAPIAATTATTGPADVADLVPLPPPTLVTVHLKKASVREALVAIANAAKIKVGVTPPGWLDRSRDQPPIDLDADEQPLLEVVNEFCCKSATLVSASNGSSWGWGEPSAADPSTPVLHIEHQQSAASLGPWVISGPFSFEVQRIDHDVPLDAGANPTPASLLLKVNEEPSVIVLGQSQRPKVAQAIDEKGQSLLRDATDNPAARQPMSWAQILARAVGAKPPPPEEVWVQQQGPVTVSISCPPNCGRTIAKLAGSERLLIQQKAGRLELALASPPVDQNKTVDGISISVDQWQVMSPQQIVFRLVIHRTNQDQTTWHRLQASMRQLHPVLLDAAGSPLPGARPMNWNSGDTECSVQFVSQQVFFGERSRSQTPVKLLLDLPTAFAVIDVPFEFANLPLP